MKKVFVILSVFILSQVSIFGQQHEFCGSEIYEKILVSNDSLWAKDFSIEEKEYQARMKSFTYTRRVATQTYVLPVVFHVIHNGGIENISDEDIYNSLDMLNNAFANQGAYFDISGVDTKIAFCLAKTDDAGNLFTGIKRYQSPYTDMSLTGSFEYLNDVAIFDHSKYLNIQIVKNACLGSNCNIAGFGGPDRAVIQAKSLFTSTFMHEIGHYLGLKHTFQGGCKNDDCLEDGDSVCDTPPDAQTFDGCPDGANSCSTDSHDTRSINPFRDPSLGGFGDQPDNNTNYLDYNFASCRKMFTAGQKDRMRFFIENRYQSLLVSNVCTPPCPFLYTVDFDLPDQIDIGTNFMITNKSVGADSYEWYINGIKISSERDLEYIFNEEGDVKVTLYIDSKDSLCAQKSLSKSIKVVCNLRPCIDTSIIGNYLIFVDCSTNSSVRRWNILRGNDTILTSVSKTDSIKINIPDDITISLELSDTYCIKMTMKHVIINPNNVEICDNGRDDDGDGFTDRFDTDCPCDTLSYQAHCPSDCVLVPDSFPRIKMKLKWESEITAEDAILPLVYEKDNKVSILMRKRILIGTFPPPSFFPIYNDVLLQIDGSNGNTTNSYDFPYDVDYNNLVHKNKFTGDIEFFFTTWDTLHKVVNGIWVKSVKVPNALRYQLSLADLDHDGNPELICGTNIINPQTLNSLFESSTTLGCLGDKLNDCAYGNTIAADFTDSPGLELAAGNTLYTFEINNKDGKTGNIVTTFKAKGPDFNGLTGFGDIDGDGHLDIIVVQDVTYPKGGKVVVWNPITGDIIADGQSFIYGSLPSVADLDGDCLPEIIICFQNKLIIYKYDFTTKLKVFKEINIKDSSGKTGVSIFDLNNDGKVELIHRDEEFLRIINGQTFEIIDSFKLLSRTTWEYPVIVDVDHDGQAEILISGFLPGEQAKDARLFCFETADFPWAPARSVWNQYCYHVTNVNDDLTIPQYQQNISAFFDTDSCAQFTCRQPYNNVLMQATDRTKKGCKVWPTVSDLSVRATATCVGDSLDICIYSIGRPDTMTFIPVSCYVPIQGINNIETTLVETSIFANSDTICMRIARQPDVTSMYIVINDDGKLGFDINDPTSFSKVKSECRYDNNVFILAFPDLLEPVDLGPDKSSCLGQIEILSAPLGYDAYKWNDGSSDFSITTGLSGIYWVEAKDTTCHVTSIDTIMLSIEASFQIDLGADRNVCQDDTLILNYVGAADMIQWHPEKLFKCPNCNETEFTGTNDTLVSILVIRDGCVSTDSVNINFVKVDKIEMGPTIQICKNSIDSLKISTPYDSLYWSPSDRVSCDTCYNTHILGNTDFILSLNLFYKGCKVSASSSINYIEPISETREILICEDQSFRFRDSIWTKSGNYTYKIGACDSIINFTIKENESSHSFMSINICDGDSTYLGGQWYDKAGSYKIVTQNHLGCDSIINLEVKAIPADSIISKIIICPGDSSFIHDVWQKQSGTYSKTYSNTLGCDSLNSVVLEIKQIQFEKDKISICAGDSLYLNGKAIYSAGEYIDTIKVENDCYKILTTVLTVINPVHETKIVTLCPDSTLVIGNEILNQSGKYDFNLISKSGCDSTLTVILNKYQWPEPPTISLDCINERYIASWKPQYPWEIEWDNGSRDTIHFSKDGIFNVKSFTDGCQKNYSYDLPKIPKLNEIPQLLDQKITNSSSLPIHVDIDETSWSILWAPASLFSCDTCFKTNITSTTDTTITVLLKHISGCSYEQQFKIFKDLNSEISIPNIFNTSSTNGNNLWKVNLPPNWTVIEVFIFDRWGNKVLSILNDNQIAWDGTFQGQTVSQGVYVYYLKLLNPDGKIILFYGDVTLVR